MAKPVTVEGERLGDLPTKEELEQILALQAENEQLMETKKVFRDTFDALQSELYQRYCEVRFMQDEIRCLQEEILKQACEQSKEEESKVAMTHGNGDTVEHSLSQLFNSPSTSERLDCRHVPRGVPSWVPDSGVKPYKGAGVLSPETLFSANELAMGNSGLQRAIQATVSRNLLESQAACAAGATGPWTTVHKIGIPASYEYQASTQPISPLHQPHRTPNPPGVFPRPTQRRAEMPPGPSHTIGTAMARESSPETAALQTNKLTMQQSSHLATTGTPMLQDVSLHNIKAHDSQFAQCKLSEHRNEVEPCKPQHHVNVQQAEPEQHLYGSGRLVASSSVQDDFTCSVPVDPPQSDRSQSNSNTPREQQASSHIDPGVTTLVVRNVPARYTKKELLQEWSPDGTFDFLYLPFNHRLKRAAGYCYVNFTSHEAAVTFHNQWHHKWLSASKHTGKKLSIGVAEFQGLAANLQHLVHCGKRVKNTKYLPSVFNADREIHCTEQTSSDILLTLRTNGPHLQSVEGSA